MENSLAIPQKVNTYNMIQKFHLRYSGELKTYVNTKTCTQMFMAALFTIAKKQKLPRCPLIDEWINKGC